MTNGLPRRASLLLLLLLPSTTGCAAEPVDSPNSAQAGPLFNQIEYRFAGDRDEVDSAGWRLLWVATIDGDLSGEARWWFEEPNPIADVALGQGSIAYYEARWEIHIDDEVVLAGRSGGKTVTVTGGDGIWDGHGVVTEASTPYQAYVGRRTYETGPVILGDDPPSTSWGRGLFTIH